MDAVNNQYRLSENETQLNSRHFAKIIFIRSLILRLAILLTILSLQPVVSEFIIIDDATMDRFANIYLSTANGIIDLQAFASSLIDIGGQSNYHVWYWIVAVLTYLFKNSVVIRFLNIIISSMSSVLVFYLCLENDLEIQVAKKTSKLYAYMPYPVIFSCFEIKDVFFTTLILALWMVLIRIHKDNKWSASRIIALIVLIPIIRNIRGGVFEIILLVFVATYIPRTYKNRKYVQLILIVAIAGIAAVLFGQSVAEVFMQKISWYSVYNRIEGTISLFRIDSIGQIYKLPLAYLWSFVQPLISPSTFGASFWLGVMSALNLTAVPIMIWNVILLVRRKKNWFYWCTLGLHLASIILSLGTFRHYFYVVPYIYMNSAYSRSGSDKGEYTVVFASTLIISIFFISYTLLGTL